MAFVTSTNSTSERAKVTSTNPTSRPLFLQRDHHFLTLLRYVEANPLRAKLVARAQLWNWSSLGCDADRVTRGVPNGIEDIPNSRSEGKRVEAEAIPQPVAY
jgi:hypothetical protein